MGRVVNMGTRPNLVVICADQVSAKHVGCLGGPAGLTPNIDALAERGVRFRQAYSAGPPCIPARASMMTGLWPHTHGKSAHIRMPLDPRIRTLPQALRDLGYRTGVVGKTHWWPADDTFGFNEAELTIDTHLTPELGRADAYIRFLEEHELFTYNAATWAEDRPRLRPPELPEDALKVNWTGAAACGMLDRFAQHDDPFFLFCSFVEPHGAGSVTEAAAEAIRDVRLPPRIPPGGRNKPAFLEQAAAGWERRRSPERIEGYRRGVAASLHLVDNNVGQLLRRIDDLGLRDSTVVAFLTDHGDFCHDHGFIEKTIPYEPAINIPFLMAGPGIEAGQECENLVSQIDLMPTLLDYAGQDDAPAPLQGRSLRPLAQGDAVPWRDAVFCECDATVHLRGAGLNVRSAQAKTVRQGPWKYTYWIVNGDETAEELYRLDTDPDEGDNLALDEDHRTRCEALRWRILDWLMVTEADRLLPAAENTYPVPQPGDKRR